MQIVRLAIMPIGKSRCGLRVSSAVVETASNPMKAKKTMAAPLMTPPNPEGIKGCQLVGFTMNEPKEMKKTTTATLMITIVAVRPRAFPDSVDEQTGDGSDDKERGQIEGEGMPGDHRQRGGRKILERFSALRR